MTAEDREQIKFYLQFLWTIYKYPDSKEAARFKSNPKNFEFPRYWIRKIPNYEKIINSNDLKNNDLLIQRVWEAYERKEPIVTGFWQPLQPEEGLTQTKNQTLQPVQKNTPAKGQKKEANESNTVNQTSAANGPKTTAEPPPPSSPTIPNQPKPSIFLQRAVNRLKQTPLLSLGKNLASRLKIMVIKSPTAALSFIGGGVVGGFIGGPTGAAVGAASGLGGSILLNSANQSSPFIQSALSTQEGLSNASNHPGGLPGLPLGGIKKKAFLNPTVFWILIALLIVLIFAVIIAYFSGTQYKTEELIQENQKVKIELSGPNEIENNNEIAYTAKISYNGKGSVDLNLTAKIEYFSEAETTTEANPFTTSINELTAAEPQEITFSLAPPSSDVWVKTYLTSEITRINKPPKGVVDTASVNLAEIFESASQNSNIPTAALKAIARRESEVLNFNENDIAMFSKEGWWEGLVDSAPTLSDNDPLVRRGYAYNTCKYISPTCLPNDVRGAMQFELATWNSVKPNITSSSSPDRRNVRDVIFGAAELLKNHAVKTGVGAASGWTQDTVKKVARAYCTGSINGDTKTPHCGWKPGEAQYEDVVWMYYQRYNE